MTSAKATEFAQVTTTGERASIRFERILTTDVDDAWRIISDPQRIARWFAPVTVAAREWATYWDDGREYARGEILRCEPPQVIEVSWFASDDAEPFTETILRVTLTPHDDGVLLVLEHEDLLAADVLQYAPGWHAFLERLPAGEPDSDFSSRFAELTARYARHLE